MRRLRRFSIVALLLGCATAAAQPSWQLENVARFVAVADIHGAYDAFETMLHRAGLIDESLNWTGGSDHLIIVGDVLDRGADSRRALDLIMRLEGPAQAAGGAVHLVLGNHELMNLTGDLRYVAPGEYAAFASDETPEMRIAALAGFAGTPEEFEAQYPPGFFAHRAAFSATGHYGAWLLERPFLLVVNDWAFVHGGLASASRNLLAEDLNAVLREQLRSYTIALDALKTTGVLNAGDNFYDHPALLEAWAAAVESGERFWPEAAEAAANIVADLNAAFAFETQSPVWYRGNVGCNALIESDRLATTLELIGVRHLVIGHTPTRDATVHSHLGGQVFRVDTGMLNEYYGGRGAALVVEGERVHAIYEDEDAAHQVSAQPRRLRLRPAGMSADQLGEFLKSAEIVTVTPVDARWSKVTLRSGATELEAVFTRNGSRNSQPDLAAWRLDGMLGLDMVPMTVAREVDGAAGTLQYLPARAMTEEQRQSRRAGAGAWCSLPDQFGAMYVFDALIGNTGRTLDRLLYNTENFHLMLVGHDAAFSTSRDKPPHLSELDLPLTPLWIERLQALDETGLEEALGDVLDRRRIAALLSRRDAILEDAGIQP